MRDFELVDCVSSYSDAHNMTGLSGQGSFRCADLRPPVRPGSADRGFKSQIRQHHTRDITELLLKAAVNMGGKTVVPLR